MIGQVQSFDENVAVKFIEMLVEGDEVERALWVLDNLPAFYRDNPPFKLARLRQDILGALCTPHAYLSSGLDAEVKPQDCEHLLNTMLRGILVQREVARYNRRGLVPHIVDVGPGEYFVPIGLQAKGFRFTYWDVAFDQNTQRAAHPILKEVRQERAQEDQPLIFLALEIIEHLPSPTDLVTEALRHCGRWPDRAHLSTPYYTYDGSKKDWRKPCGLPHLRAYTAKEFAAVVEKLFPNYKFELFPSQIMSLRGQRFDKIDPDPIYTPGDDK
jgi:hypothetical protein